MDLEQIQKRIETLEGAQNEAKQLKLTLEDALKEDEKYQEFDMQLRDLNIKKKEIKDQVWNDPTYQSAVAKLKELKEEIRDTQEILNHELLQWHNEHKSDEIISSDGSTRKLKINIRLQLPKGEAY